MADLSPQSSCRGSLGKPQKVRLLRRLMEPGWPLLFPRAITPVLHPYWVSDHGKLPRASIPRPVIRLSPLGRARHPLLAHKGGDADRPPRPVKDQKELVGFRKPFHGFILRSHATRSSPT